MSITLTGTGTVTLKNPMLGNTYSHDDNKTIVKAQNGDILTYRDAPTIEKLNLTFQWLEPADLVNLKTFLKANIGTVVTYLDHESILWDVKIITWPLEIVFTRKCVSGDLSTVSFILQGKPISGDFGIGFVTEGDERLDTENSEWLKTEMVGY